MADTVSEEYVSGLGDVAVAVGRRGEPRLAEGAPPVTVVEVSPAAGLTPAAKATKELVLMRALEQRAASDKMITRLREDLGLGTLPDPIQVIRYLEWEGGTGRRCPACQQSEVHGHQDSCDIKVLLLASASRGGVTCR